MSGVSSSRTYSVDESTKGKRSFDADKPDSEKQFRHIAAIDIGTNSTHLLIALVDTSLNTFSVEHAEKSTTRLGEKDSDSGELTDFAMQRVIETLSRFKELADSYQVETLILAATSAVREAPNGEAFLRRIKEDIRVDVDLVSGAEEARLIYLGVLSGMNFGERPHFVLDIGGGSTELILADGVDARALTSTRVGAVRLQRDFIKEEPISPSRRTFLQTFIQGSLEPAVVKVLDRMAVGEKPVMVATSGTAMAIGALSANDEDRPLLKFHGHKVSRKKLNFLVDKLLEMTPGERKALPSMNDRRAEIIVPGALILQTAMQMLDVEEMVLSERALREGLIIDWMLRQGLLEDRLSFQSSIRKRTVVHQAKRFAVNNDRAESVATHALSLYDQTRGLLHQDTGEGRDLLWAAGMLHACGQHINRSSYHKHSWYLIRHGDLLGYSQSEHLMVAAIARYHRRSLPKKRHEAWQSLISKGDRQVVLEMSLLLRLAVAIDRRPKPAVDSIGVQRGEGEITLVLSPKTKAHDLVLERWSLLDCALVVREASGYDLQVLIQR